MVLHNPNNWHWVNKDAAPWAKSYLESQVVAIAAEEGDISAKVTKLSSMDGDVEVSQRKGKVISIFDVALTLEYEGTYNGCKPIAETNRVQARTKRVPTLLEALESRSARTIPKKMNTLYVSAQLCRGAARTNLGVVRH